MGAQRFSETCSSPTICSPLRSEPEYLDLALAQRVGRQVGRLLEAWFFARSPGALEEPTAEILDLFREHQAAVVAWFRFELPHTILGNLIGETFGYALTATFTVLVVIGLRRTIMPRWMAQIGNVAAGLLFRAPATSLRRTGAQA